MHGPIEHPAATALARLIQLLGCSEEAAYLGFTRLHDCMPQARRYLQRVAADELEHEALLAGLGAVLPRVEPNEAALTALRCLHTWIGTLEMRHRCMAIAALDSATCLLLSRLLRSDCDLLRDSRVVAVLSRIRKDEARHVRITREIALRPGRNASLAPIAARVRFALADALRNAADDWETVGLDADTLLRCVSDLPAGLAPR